MGIPGQGIASQIPGIGTLGAVTRIRRWIHEFRAFGFDRMDSAVHAERDSAVHLIKEVGFRKWARFWHYGRTLIDLQSRLFFEQIYSDLGKPWSDLVTGFGPVTAIVISPKVLAREKKARLEQQRAQKKKKSNASYGTGYDPGTFGGR